MLLHVVVVSEGTLKANHRYEDLRSWSIKFITYEGSRSKKCQTWLEWDGVNFINSERSALNLSVIFNFLRVLAGYTISNFGLVTSFITNLALVTKMDHWNADQLEGQMAQYVGQDSRMLIPILSATVRTYGMNTAQKLLDGVEPPEGASKEYKELLSFAKDIFEEADEIIDEHTGDSDPDEVHGLDEDDYSKNALAEDVAFDMIAELDGRLGRGTLDLLRSSVIIEQAHIERYRKLFPRGRHNY